jgi:hypothetical protein
MIWKDPRLILIENNPVYKPYAKCLNINKNNQVAFTKTVTTNSVNTYHEQGAVVVIIVW